MNRNILYYENRIHLLESRENAANRAIINKCQRKLRQLKKKEGIENGCEN